MCVMKEVIFLALQTVVLAVSAGLVLWKIKKSIEEVAKTHDWNRRKASQEACYEFMHQPTATSWNKICEPIVREGKTYEELSNDQKEAARAIMNYFENLGILIKHSVVDKEIIYDYFQSTWHPFFDASRNYVENMRGVVRDETVFENFGRYAEDFSSLNRKREKARSEAGRIPPRGEIQ